MMLPTAQLTFVESLSVFDVDAAAGWSYSFAEEKTGCRNRQAHERGIAVGVISRECVSSDVALLTT
jgi:hypothetical protein